MSTATVKLKHGALATVTPDFMITRGITETHSLTLLNADNTALINASVVTWTFQIAQDFLSRTSILAESTSITFANNVLSEILLNAHTVELKAFMQGKAIAPLYGTLIGLNGSAEVVTAITFRIVCTNSVYEPDAEPTPAIISGYYTKAQIDAKFAAIGDTLGIPTDINQLDDADGLLFDGDYNSLQNIPAIPADVSDLTDSGGLIPADLTDLTDTTGLFAAKEDAANKATDFSTVNDTKYPTVKAVKDFAQNETLAELTGSSVTVAPWTQSKWSASGVCTLTASGWAASGRQAAYIVITLAAGATLSIIDTEEVAEDDALSAAGVYECFLKNVDGKIYFHQISFTEAVA